MVRRAAEGFQNSQGLKILHIGVHSLAPVRKLACLGSPCEEGAESSFSAARAAVEVFIHVISSEVDLYLSTFLTQFCSDSKNLNIKGVRINGSCR